MPYRRPLDVADYIAALGDDEAELKHVMKLSERGRHNGEPYKWPGDGTAVCSVSTDLARRDDVVWDANGYYAALGFTDDLRSVTKRQMRLAYRELLNDPDLDHVWITYCFKQLLNPQVRADYNAMSFGEIYFDDYWEAYFKAQAEEQVRAKARAGLDIPIEDILAQWGLQALGEEQKPPEIDWESVAEEKPKKVIESEWDWAFYVWDARSVNLFYLEMWQKLILKALQSNREFGRRVLEMTQFAVGVMGHAETADTPRVTSRVYNNGKESPHYVFYLRSDVKPTKKDAEGAVRDLIRIARQGNNMLFPKVRGQPARV